MQILANFPNLIDRWLRYRFQTILIVCFLVWTPFLVAETLQVQHSCYPMINWSDTLSTECQATVPQTNSSSSKKPETQRDRSQEQKQIAQSDRRPSPKSSPTSQKTEKEHPDLTGAVIAIGVVGTVAVVAGVPLALALGIGAAVLLAIKTVL